MAAKENPPQAGQADLEMDLPQLLLNRLNENEHFDSIALAEHLKLPHQKVIGAIKSIQNHEGVSYPLLGYVTANTLII